MSNLFIAEVIQKYVDQEAKREWLEGEIKRIEAEIKQMPSWINVIIHPIVEEMSKDPRLADRRYELFGPFGLSCELSIHFYRKGITDRNELYHSDNCLSITFLPDDVENGKVNLKTRENTHRYAEGTLAEANGFNYKSVPIKRTIKELVDFLFEQNKGKVENAKVQK